MNYLPKDDAQTARAILDMLLASAAAGTDAVIRSADFEIVLLALFTMLLASEHAELVVEFPKLHG